VNFAFYSERYYIAKYTFSSEQISRLTDTGNKRKTKNDWLADRGQQLRIKKLYKIL